MFKFQGDATDQQAETWLYSILETLPDGAEGYIRREPLIVTVPELGPEHEGYQIVIARTDKEKSIRGRLDTVYPAGTSNFNRIVVVDGRAYDASAYEVATLIDS